MGAQKQLGGLRSHYHEKRSVSEQTQMRNGFYLFKDPKLYLSSFLEESNIKQT